MSLISLPRAHRVFIAPSVAGLFWFGVALSTGYWFWQFPQGPVVPQSIVPTSAPHAVSTNVSQLSRALGAAHTESALTANNEVDRLTLQGVIADHRGQGKALIALDEQPPKPFQIGQLVSGGLVLQSLGHSYVLLGATINGPTLRELTLPTVPAQ